MLEKTSSREWNSGNNNSGLSEGMGGELSIKNLGPTMLMTDSHDWSNYRTTALAYTLSLWVPALGPIAARNGGVVKIIGLRKMTTNNNNSAEQT